MTLGFGFGAEKGTKEHQVEHRARTYYNHFFKQVENDLPPSVAQQINKDRHNFNLSNKFEYGHDKDGGAKSVLKQDPDSPAKIKQCLDESAKGHG